jgi:hypothetical protein
MFGWAAATTDCAVRTVPEMELAGTFVRLDPDPEKVPAETVPVTARLERVPTEVMFGCAACDTT